MVSKTKGGEVIRLLSRKRGATMDELIEATCWQRGSVMSRISHLRREGQKVDQVSEGRYHLVPA